MEKPESRSYSIKGVKFTQQELLYDELLAVLKLIGSELKDFSGSADNLGKMIDRWEEINVLPELFKIVIHVDNSNPFRQLLNRWFIWRKGVNPADPIRSMTAKQIARVSTDFFLLNASWLITWINMPMNSVSSLKGATPTQMYQVLTSAFSQPAPATSQEPQPSEDSKAGK